MLKLGFLTVLLSDQLIQGLTTGAAIHVFTSQVKHIFGIEVPSTSSYLVQLRVKDHCDLVRKSRYGFF